MGSVFDALKIGDDDAAGTETHGEGQCSTFALYSPLWRDGEKRNQRYGSGCRRRSAVGNLYAMPGSRRRRSCFQVAPLCLGVFAVSLLAGGPRIAVLTNFEGGSIGKVEEVSPTHLRCAVKGQADQDHRNRQANWYYFELTNLPHAPITIDLVDLAGEYNYHGPEYSVVEGVRPVYSDDGLHWRNFTDQQVSWDPHEPHLTLQFTPAHAHLWIAHVTPYTNRNLVALLDSFRRSPYLAVESVGRTVEGREMPLVTITNPRAGEGKKRVIWLMFRQHAWETGSSWACEGAVRFLLSSDARALRLRDQMIYKIFPLADPDGVAHGGVRFNVNGYDLNRNWDTFR